MVSSIEARTAERIAVSNPVNILVTGRVILAAVAANISLGGLFLHAEGLPPVGSPCEIAIFLPDGDGFGNFVAHGRVVRSGARGAAIQFAQALEHKALESIVRPGATPVLRSMLDSYLNYFKVSQSMTEADCELYYGISARSFRVVSTGTFMACLPAAFLPVWALRAYLPALPDWTKIGALFAYGALWLLVLQPLIDLAVFKAFRLVRSRK